MTEQYVEELIRKYAAGTASDEEVQKLMQWYRSAPIDEVNWPSAGANEQDDVYHRMLERLQKKSRQPARLLRFTWARVAALLVLCIGVAAVLIYSLKPFSPSYITLTNPSGQIQLVRLPDSSSVWLNASSTLRYEKEFTKSRELELAGEGYFQVTHDAKHPFTVKAGGARTTVLGTTFNIKAYGPSNTTTISVITGKVKVSNSSKELAVLTPAIQLQFDRQRQTAKTLAIDTNAVLAWKKGRLQFQGETFGEIANTLESWYGIRIIFANPGMRSCRYYISFDNTISIDKLMSTMSEITEMQFAFNNNRDTITLSGKECR